MKEAYGEGGDEDEGGGSVSDPEHNEASSLFIDEIKDAAGRASSLSDEYDEFDDEEKENANVVVEAFSFDEFLVNFAKPEVLFWYIQLLRAFETNTPEENKALLKMLHRIAFDLRTPSRLYSVK